MNDKDQMVIKLRFPEFTHPWKSDNLGNIFTNRQETGFPDLPLMSLTNEYGLVIQEKTNKRDNSSENKSKYLRICEGDIVYNTMRMWQGRCAYCKKEGIVSPAYTVCIPKDTFDGEFLNYYFKTYGLIQKFHINSQGLVSDTLNLKFNKFSSITIDYPVQKEEQQKIADCLSSIDELIDAESRKLKALEKHKKGLMQKLFPADGKTLPEWRFPEFQGCGDWESKSIGKACKMFSGGTPDTSKKEFYGDTIPFIRSAEINKSSTELFITEEGLKNSSAKMVKKGDILIALYGANSGEAALSKIDGAINQAILCLRHGTNNAFVYHYFTHMKSRIISKYIQGGQGNLSGQIIKSVNLYFTKAEEQEKIAACLSEVDAMITEQSNKVEQLKAHKKGLMQGLFPSLEEADV